MDGRSRWMAEHLERTRICPSPAHSWREEGGFVLTRCSVHLTISCSNPSLPLHARATSHGAQGAGLHLLVSRSGEEWVAHGGSVWGLVTLSLCRKVKPFAV